MKTILPLVLLISASLFYLPAFSETYYEIDGSAYATADAPLPQYITPPGEKVIVVDPNEHVWGAYLSNGKLHRWGIATTGSNWCRDLKRPCRTQTGTFRIYSLGDSSCTSKKFPMPGGGAPMPYCMFFNRDEAIHGSDNVEYANVSHGCVRVHVSDAKWLRFHFVDGPSLTNQYRGTKVIIKKLIS